MLKDQAMALMSQELDPDFEKLCVDIAESRKKRGEASNTRVPKAKG